MTYIFLLLSLFYFLGQASLCESTSPEGGVVKFTRLYASEDGSTHLQDCSVQDMEQKKLPGGGTPQYIKDLGDMSSGLIFTQMFGQNPWHQCPTSQFVIVLEGRWSVNVTSSVLGEFTYVEMGPGHVLYQDDYNGFEINDVEPMHFSQSLDGLPCNQLIVSVDRKYVLDDTSCDWVDQFMK